MRSRRRVNAVLAEVHAAARPGEEAALDLVFLPRRSRVVVESIRDRVVLGPPGSVAAALGRGRVLRLLAAGRVALPERAEAVLDDPDAVATLLRRTLGVEVVLELRPRAEVRFTLWTERGVESVSDVADVIEDARGWVVRRRGGRPPVVLSREHAVRGRTDCDTWFEVTAVERAG